MNVQRVGLALVLLNLGAASAASAQDRALFLAVAVEETRVEPPASSALGSSVAAMLRESVSQAGLTALPGVGGWRLRSVLTVTPMGSSEAGLRRVNSARALLSVELVMPGSTASQWSVRREGRGSSTDPGMAAERAVQAMLDVQDPPFADELRRGATRLVSVIEQSCASVLGAADAERRRGEAESALGILASVPASAETCARKAATSAEAILAAVQRRGCGLSIRSARAARAVGQLEEAAIALTNAPVDGGCDREVNDELRALQAQSVQAANAAAAQAARKVEEDRRARLERFRLNHDVELRRLEIARDLLLGVRPAR